MYRLGNALSPVKEKESLLIDLLLRPQAEESDHRIRAVVALRFQPALGGNRRHTGGTLVCLPRRAVARPLRPHRTPCHRRATHRRFATPCGSGTASHRVRRIRANGGHGDDSTDKRAECPLDPRLKTCLLPRSSRSPKQTFQTLSNPICNRKIEVRSDPGDDLGGRGLLNVVHGISKIVS